MVFVYFNICFVVDDYDNIFEDVVSVFLIYYFCRKLRKEMFMIWDRLGLYISFCFLECIVVLEMKKYEIFDKMIIC